jgi:hypothetical protein
MAIGLIERFEAARVILHVGARSQLEVESVQE